MSGRPWRKSAEIGLFSPLFLPSLPFSGGCEDLQKTEEKGLFPQISSDLLKPPFAALQQRTQNPFFGHFSQNLTILDVVTL